MVTLGLPVVTGSVGNLGQFPGLRANPWSRLSLHCHHAVSVTKEITGLVIDRRMSKHLRIINKYEWKASPQQAQEEQEEEQQQDEYRYVISFWSRKVVNTVQRTVQTEKKQQRQSVFNAGQASGSWFEYHLRLKRETVVVIRVECFDE